MILTRRLSTVISILHRGGVIAYPTEAVWGLGCDPFNAEAVKKLLALKQRLESKGLILLAGTWQALAPWLETLSKKQRQQLQAYWPGFSTVLIEDQKIAPPWIRGQHHTVALRLTAHPPAVALCRAFGKPLVSTSANIAYQEAARNPASVFVQFLNQPLDAIWLAPTGYESQPSSIYELSTGIKQRG